MTELAAWLAPERVDAAVLVLFRVGALVLLAPGFGHPLVPAPVKAGLVAMLALALAPLAPPAPAPDAPWAWALAALRELLLGAGAALALRLVFAAMHLAGQLAGTQMGLAIAATLDPEARAQTGTVAELALLFAFTAWLALGGHRAVLLALAHSLAALPPGAPWPLERAGDLAVLGGQVFALALRLAAPVVGLLLLAYLALGLLARASPQIQVFFLSFPLTTALGLWTLAAALPAAALLLAGAWEEAARQAAAWLGG